MILHNSRGNTLITVVVSAALVSVISLAAAQMISQMRSQAAQLDAAIEAGSLEGIISRTLLDSSNCLSSLTSKAVNTSQFTKGYPITIQLPGSLKNIAANQDYGPLKITSLNYVSLGAPVSLGGGQSGYNGRLELLTEHTSTKFKFRTRTIEPLTLVTQGNTVVGCSLAMSVAATPTPAPSPTPAQASNSVGNPTLAGVTCPKTSSGANAITGFDSSGKPICAQVVVVRDTSSTGSGGSGSTASKCQPGWIYCVGASRCVSSQKECLNAF